MTDSGVVYDPNLTGSDLLVLQNIEADIRNYRGPGKDVSDDDASGTGKLDSNLDCLAIGIPPPQDPLIDAANVPHHGCSLALEEHTDTNCNVSHAHSSGRQRQRRPR